MQFCPTFSSTSSSLSRAEGLGWEDSHHVNHVGLHRGAFLAWPEVHSRLELPVLGSGTGLPSESPTCPSRILVMMLLLRVAEKSYTVGGGGLVCRKMRPTSLVSSVLTVPSTVPGAQQVLRWYTERND